jgi:hypothetical protein
MELASASPCRSPAQRQPLAGAFLNRHALQQAHFFHLKSIVTCSQCRTYTVAITQLYFRVYDRPHDHLSKNDHFQAMPTTAAERGFQPSLVGFDSWYASLKNLTRARSQVAVADTTRFGVLQVGITLVQSPMLLEHVVKCNEEGQLAPPRIDGSIHLGGGRRHSGGLLPMSISPLSTA